MAPLLQHWRDLSELVTQLREVITRKGLRRLAEPVQLASGELSTDFVDCKAALCEGDDLALACQGILEALDEHQVSFDAIGGLTMGADQFAHGVAILASKRWFVVRKTPKGRGTDRLVEGAALVPGLRTVVVEDCVTTGGSIVAACHAVEDTGATVAAAITLVDRGDTASAFFAGQAVPYISILTYRDLGIAPVGRPDPAEGPA